MMNVIAAATTTTTIGTNTATTMKMITKCYWYTTTTTKVVTSRSLSRCYVSSNIVAKDNDNNNNDNVSVSSAMIRTLYRDFIHIAKIQQKQQQRNGTNSNNNSNSSSIKSKANTDTTTNTTSPSSSILVSTLQQIRKEFRTQLQLNDTIHKRYLYGLNRLSFIRMNTIQYKPRGAGYYTYNNTNNANQSSLSSSSERQRFIYKNGQRYELNNNNSLLLMNDTNHLLTLRHDKGYTISPYTGNNLDPQNVTRHRQNLKRAGFINNAHAKGFF